jgi:hypothetical protein
LSHVESEYDTNLSHVESRPVMQSSAKLTLSVQGATVEHHDNRPIRFAHVWFGEGPFDANRAGRLQDLGMPLGVNIIATLPRSDFPAFWSALHLEHEVTLVCTIALGADELGTDRVVGLSVSGRQS